MTEAAPPPYSAAPNGNDSYTKDPSKSDVANHPAAGDHPRQLSPNMSSQKSKSLFPQSFGFYHASGTHSDMAIALSSSAPPIFHVSTHGGFSSKPSVALHSGPFESTPVLATADFHSFSSSVDVMLNNNRIKLERDGAFSTVTYFGYPITQPNGNTRPERFEWKSSSGAEVQGLQGSKNGRKLVRVTTGEVVAAWARPNSGTRKKGKMSFLMRNRGLGDDKFETMIVISILSIMEKARRSKNARHGAAAGGGAGGAAGGGC